MAIMDPAPAPAAIEFGRFRILPHRRELHAEGGPVELGGRAFDILMALIQASGAVVSKDTLIERVWPDRVVEENTLQAQISALRRALGADRHLIRTVAGRGYQFIGELHSVSADMPATAGMAQPALAPSRPPTNLPEPISELIGRDAELEEILKISASHRLVTLTGAGGIGKTRLGFEAARALLPQFADGVWAVELAPLSDPDLVPVAIATALGLELTSGTASPLSVANALRAKQLMLLFDNCEHVVDAAARMAEALLRSNPAARVIATSREPIQVEGEWVYPVPPLAVPAEVSRGDEDPLLYGAVRLFVERARAAAPHFPADARVAAASAGICRRLDGIPLAIELAAPRVATLGIEGLAAGLDDRFRLLAGGRRTALPRHQTLRATMDWSYELLTEPERVVLRRLAVFAGGFTLQAASGVAADDEIAASEVVDCVANLVTKSLVIADVGAATVRYRLLETTRAYALEKLVETGDFDTAAQRHARHYLDLFDGAETEAETRPTDAWLADYVPSIDNLRAALDWAFSSDGDTSIGLALATAAVPLWVHLSLMDECRSRVEQALALLGTEPREDAARGMKLYAALATSLTYTGGTESELEAAWTRTLELAERLDDTECRLRAAWELWTLNRVSRLNHAALTHAQRVSARAANRTDPNHRLVGERMLGISCHYQGDQVRARRHLEGVLDAYVETDNRSHIVRFQVDLRVSARTFLAPSLWLLGYPDQAMGAAEAAVEDARAANHALSVCHALVFGACPTALLAGDLPRAEHYAGMLIDHSVRHGLARWHAYGSAYHGALVIKRGDIAAGLQLLRAGFDELGGFATLRFMDLLMPEALWRAGEIARGLATVDQAIARSEATEEHRLVAELFRIKGELLLLQGAAGAAATAEDHFRQALDWARRQGALSWELRAATSLARLLSDQGRSADAKALLQPVYDRFTEGFATADPTVARVLLDELS
jgi:predicted ATPase/DNA-binding winged helix-turn-helix (wHTH) protein